MGKNIFENEDFENNPIFKSDDLMQKAYDAKTKKEGIKLAQEAIKIYKDNIDAYNFIAIKEKDSIKRLNYINENIERATKILEKDNFFKEDIGSFWGILETRPYMRTRNLKILTLIELGRYKEAEKECEELLKLSSSDNLGIRFILIGLYIMLEKFNEAEKLYKKYKSEHVFMTFPLAIMQYKKGEYEKAKKLLKKIQKENKNIFYIIKNFNVNCLEEKDIPYYEIGSLEEAYLLIYDLKYLILSVPHFPIFIKKYIK